MAEHTIKAFDQEMDKLRGLIAEMGGRAESAIEKAMLALQRHDKVMAAEVVAEDKRIDAIEAEVEKLAIEIIALRAPMANDLRDVIAALKIVGVVERIGDYAKNIAKRVPLISANQRTQEPIALLPSMGQVAGEMVQDALNAFAARDADLAVAWSSATRWWTISTTASSARSSPSWSKIPRRSANARICCSSPRISSGSATMPPMWRRWSIMPRPARPCPTANAAARRRRADHGARKDAAGGG